MRIGCIFLHVFMLFIHTQVLGRTIIQVVKFSQYIHPKPMGLIFGCIFLHVFVLFIHKQYWDVLTI
jgi:hypothetical protein